jgi:hypothetical protein
LFEGVLSEHAQMGLKFCLLALFVQGKNKYKVSACFFENLVIPKIVLKAA